MSYSFIQNVTQSIQEASEKGLLKETPHLSGYSGEKMIGVLQRLAVLNTSEEKAYVEIGVFQGMTLLSVANAVSHDVYGIDKFAFFDKDNKNQSIINERKKKIGLTNAQLINLDYEDALEDLKKYIGDKKVGLFFVDGPHDYRSQLVCLLFIKPYLADDAIIIVDDSNYRHVRQANRDFLYSHPEFKLIFEAYTECHPQNMTESQVKEEARKGWWNGINVMVRDKDNLVNSMFPPTHRHRGLYENEHSIHSNRFPESALMGNRFSEAIHKFKILEILEIEYKFFKKFLGRKSETPKFEHGNTYSEDLPKYNLNNIKEESLQP